MKHENENWNPSDRDVARWKPKAADQPETAYFLALKLKGKLLSDISYQERVIQNAGECYPGHSEDIQDYKKLLGAVDEFIASCEKGDD